MHRDISYQRLWIISTFNFTYFITLFRTMSPWFCFLTIVLANPQLTVADRRDFCNQYFSKLDILSLKLTLPCFDVDFLNVLAKVRYRRGHFYTSSPNNFNVKFLWIFIFSISRTCFSLTISGYSFLDSVDGSHINRTEASTTEWNFWMTISQDIVIKNRFIVKCSFFYHHRAGILCWCQRS